MKWIRPGPELLVPLIVLSVVSIIAVYLAWPALKQGVRPFLALLLPFVATGVSLFALRNDRVRVWIYRLYYRFAGPSAEATVIGSIPLSEGAAKDVLDQVTRLVREWRSDARVDARMATRVIIAAGPRTLTVTVRDETNEEPDDDTGLTQRAAVELRGYETKIGRIDELLNEEIHSLLSRMTRELCAYGTRPTWIINMSTGREVNPFLGFYLRGVPITKLTMFEAKLDEKRFGEDVNVRVTSNQLSVRAADPQALIDAARRYLTSPALAHLN